MKISLNSLKDLTEIKVESKELGELISRRLGEVEEVVNLKDKYKGILIAEIKDIEDHPDADKLSIYKLDVGKSGFVQVVAGDKTLRVGDRVAYFTPGSKVPFNQYPEKFDGVVKETKLRGVISNGMMASSKELDIGSDHSKVLRLNDHICESAESGESFAEVYSLEDYVYDVENKALTNRPDCFGLIGLAREIAGIQGIKFETPEWFAYWNKTKQVSVNEDNYLIAEEKIELKVENEAKEYCPRYMLVAMNQIEVEESPLWLQIELRKAGMRPVNNVVDVTNYIMLLTGQPLHAFDLDKILNRDATPDDNTPHIKVRRAKKGEKITVIDGKTHELDEEIVVITDGVSPIGIGGVMGGIDTEVDENTKRIALECANFDFYNIRKTSMKTGIVSDAVVRYSRNQDQNQCEAVLYKAMEMLGNLAKASLASEIHDLVGVLRENKQIEVDISRAREIIGIELAAEEVSKILENVELFNEIDGNNITVQIPTYRQDLNIEEDIYEEIGRLYGYGNIELKLPTKKLNPVSRNKEVVLQERIREELVALGATETETYSFAGLNLYSKIGLEKELKKSGYHLINALSPELEYMQISLIPSLLEKAAENQNRGYEEFALFELQKYHIKGAMDKEESKLPYEFRALGLVYSVSDELKKKKYGGSPYYQVKLYLNALLKRLNSKKVNYEEADEVSDLPVWLKSSVDIYKKGAYALITYEFEGKKYYLGVVGELSRKAKKNLKLPEYSAAFELNLERVSQIADLGRGYKGVSKYPKVTQDLCFIMDNDIPYQLVVDTIEGNIKETDDELMVSIDPVDIYKGDDTEAGMKQITLRLTLQHGSKVMDSEQIEIVRKRAIRAVRQKCNAVIKGV